MAVWRLRRETLHRIVLARLFPDDCDVSEEFDVVVVDHADDADADIEYVIV